MRRNILLLCSAFALVSFASTSAQAAYPKVRIKNTTEYTVKGTVKYVGAPVFCTNRNFKIAPLRTWRAPNRGVCLVTRITGRLSGVPKSLKGTRKRSYGEKLNVVFYSSTGTSYSRYLVSAYGGAYRIFSRQEHARVTKTKRGKSPGFYFVNKTAWPIAYSLEQVGCLYHGIVPTGTRGRPGVRKVDTGAVWFTLIMHIQADGQNPRSDWDCVKPVAELVGDVALAAITGGTSAVAKAGTKVVIKTVVKASVKRGLMEAGKKIFLKKIKDITKRELGILLKAIGTVEMYGQYAGYDWPFRCKRLPEYHITGGPLIYRDETGEAYIGQAVPFKVSKVNTCGNKMMLGSRKAMTAGQSFFSDYEEPTRTPPKRPIRPPPTSALLSWRGMVAGRALPRGAFIGGRETKRQLAICRAAYKRGVHPGKIVAGRCNIGWGGKEIVLSRYDVMIANPRNFRWVKVTNRRVPRNAVIGGQEPGRKLPICRAVFGRGRNVGVHPGKIVAGKCNIGWGGKEIVLSRYEALVPAR